MLYTQNHKLETWYSSYRIDPSQMANDQGTGPLGSVGSRDNGVPARPPFCVVLPFYHARVRITAALHRSHI